MVDDCIDIYVDVDVDIYIDIHVYFHIDIYVKVHMHIDVWIDVHVHVYVDVDITLSLTLKFSHLESTPQMQPASASSQRFQKSLLAFVITCSQIKFAKKKLLIVIVVYLDFILHIHNSMCYSKRLSHVYKTVKRVQIWTYPINSLYAM